MRQYTGAVVLVEGKSDNDFINQLVSTTSEFNIFELGGYQKIGQKLTDIQNQTKEFRQNITHLLIIVDADENLHTRRQEIIKELEKIDVLLPENYKLGSIHNIDKEETTLVKVGVYILPDNKNLGSLETLILKSVAPEFLNCIDNVIACHDNTAIASNTKNNKDKLKFNLYMGLKKINYKFNYEKTYANEIDCNHECFKDLKDFFTQAVNTTS